MLDLRRLRLLRELAHRGTIAAVAEALSYSPSAVSQQLAEQPQAPEVEHRAPSKHQFCFTLSRSFSRWT